MATIACGDIIDGNVLDRVERRLAARQAAPPQRASTDEPAQVAGPAEQQREQGPTITIGPTSSRDLASFDQGLDAEQRDRLRRVHQQVLKIITKTAERAIQTGEVSGDAVTLMLAARIAGLRVK